MLLALGVLATIVVIALLSLAGYVLAIAATAPDLSELKPADKGELSVVYAADGSRLGFIQSDVLRRTVPWRRSTCATRPWRSRTSASTSTAAST
jgi:penicillin-binding protein 1A